MSKNLEFFKTLMNGISTRIDEISNITKNVILKTEQSLNDSEKTTARNNINAASKDDVEPFTVYSPYSYEAIDKTFDEIQDAILSGRRVQFLYGGNIYPLIAHYKDHYILFGNGMEEYELNPGGTGMVKSYPEYFHVTNNEGTYRIKVDTSGKVVAIKLL